MYEIQTKNMKRLNRVYSHFLLDWPLFILFRPLCVHRVLLDLITKLQFVNKGFLSASPHFHLPKDPGSRPVVGYRLAQPYPAANGHQHIHVPRVGRGQLLECALSRVPRYRAGERKVTLTEGVCAGCQLSYLLHQAVTVGSELRVLLNTVGSHAGGLLSVNSPVRPSSSPSTAPGCVREAHPLWRSPREVTSRWVIAIQKLLAAFTTRRWTGTSWRVWNRGGFDWHDGGSNRNGARRGRCASHAGFGGRRPPNGGRPRGNDSGAAPPCTVRSALQALTGRQARCAGRSFGLDHAAVTLCNVAVAWDGRRLVEVCLALAVSVPVERVALIIRTWKKQ